MSQRHDTGHDTDHTTDTPGIPADGGEQLRLLDDVEVPLQFRLDRHTRELGTAQIAKIKAQLAARAAARAGAEEPKHSRRAA